MLGYPLIQNCTKGQALSRVANILSGNTFVVPKLLLIDVSEWFDSPEQCLRDIHDCFGNMKLVVRSSASDEDGEKSARAGEYESVLNVPANDEVGLKAAISEVISSYEEKGTGSDGEEILIQEMVTDVTSSGVVFTHDLNTGAPYYVVNYDDISGTTNTVTSGAGEYSNRTLYIHRNSFSDIRSDRFKRLLSAVRELEQIVVSNFLDIEFAIDKNLQPYLLQVRFITTQPNWNRRVVRFIDSELQGVRNFVRDRFRPMPGIFGCTTIFGQMPDWNPAEMIGRAPRALSLSLYQGLITDDAWRIARETMGYAVPAGQSLMVSLAGQPFIDTRLSFHSYLPASLSYDISRKLVDEWVQKLGGQPELHDKVEFDIAITTFTFDLEERMRRQASCLTDSERVLFRQELLSLTQPLLMGNGNGSITAALKLINQLSASDLPGTASGPLGLKRLIRDCIHFGTVPFSILARHGFMAHSLLLSLVSRGVLSEDEVHLLLGGVRTVAGELLDDMHSLRTGKVLRSDFMNRYGHLRPGTYDILSPRYDQMESLESTVVESQSINQEQSPFRFSVEQSNAINSMFDESGFGNFNSENLLSYISDAIAGREYGKFVFTRSVSVMLELIAEFGEKNGLSRDEMSHVPVDEILKIGVESDGRGVEERFREISELNANRHSLTTAIRLPQVLCDESGVHVVPFQVSQPNFITSKKVSAEAIHLRLNQVMPRLSGRIVLIENADPGYDWIFAQAIAGLVTKYGGANSHMAIRCAEFGIPAAIGCGEQRFDRLVKASRLRLDCAVGFISPLH